jgi:hypothetical protein
MHRNNWVIHLDAALFKLANDSSELKYGSTHHGKRNKITGEPKIESCLCDVCGCKCQLTISLVL